MCLHEAVRTLAIAVWNDLPTIYKTEPFNVRPAELKDTVHSLAYHIRNNYYTKLTDTAAAPPLADVGHGDYLRRFADLNLVLDSKKDTADSRAWIAEFRGGSPASSWKTNFFYLDDGGMDIHRRYYIHARPDRVPDVMAALHGWWKALPRGTLNAKAIGPAEAHRVDCIVVYAAKSIGDEDVIRTVPGDALLASVLPATVRVADGLSWAPGIKASWGETVSSSIADAAIERVMCDQNKIDQLDKESFDEDFAPLEKRRASIEAEKRSGDDALHIQLKHFDKVLGFGRPQDKVFKFLTPHFMMLNEGPFLAAVAEALGGYKINPVTLDKTASQATRALDEAEEGPSATGRPVEFLAKTRRALLKPFAAKSKGKAVQPMVEMSPDRQARAARTPTPVANSAPLFASATPGPSEKELALIRAIQNSLQDTSSGPPRGGVPLPYASATTVSGPSTSPRFPPPRSIKGGSGAMTTAPTMAPTTTLTSSGPPTAPVSVGRTPPPRPPRPTPPVPARPAANPPPPVPLRQSTHNPTIDAMQRDALVRELEKKFGK